MRQPAHAISPRREWTMQVNLHSNENTPTGQEKFFIGYSVFYAACIAALLLLEFMVGARGSWPEWLVQIYEPRLKLLGFIAAACAFLTITGKYIGGEPTQWTPELSLGIVGGLAGFGAAILLVREEANPYAQAALVVLAIPVLYSNYLLMRRLYLDMRPSVAAKIYAQIIIRGYRIIGLLIALGLIVAAVQGLLAAFGVVGVLIISAIILILLIAVALLIRRAFLNGD